VKNIWKISFFAFGLTAFVYLVWRLGLDQIVANIEKAGWSLLYVIIVWFAIYLLNTLAWQLALGGKGDGIAFPKLFMVTVSGFVLNYITPVIALGGEPYKIKILGESMEKAHSISAVVLYRMVHLLGHMFLLLTGIVSALLFLSLPFSLDVVLAAAGAVIIAVIAWTFSGHRDGIFERLTKFLAAVPLLSKAAGALRKYENNLREMDQVITDVYHNRRRKFYLSIGVEYASRACMGLEVYLILHGVGVETTVASALFLYVLYSILINVLFFIPLNLGAREGGLVVGLGTLALPPLLGVYLGVVMRIREFFWILLGLLFILLTTEKEKPSSMTTGG